MFLKDIYFYLAQFPTLKGHYQTFNVRLKSNFKFWAFSEIKRQIILFRILERLIRQTGGIRKMERHVKLRAYLNLKSIFVSDHEESPH